MLINVFYILRLTLSKLLHINREYLHHINMNGWYFKMSPDFAAEIAYKATGFVVSEDSLRDRFLTLSGLSPDEIRSNLTSTDFQASILEFLISHEPDLISCAEALTEKPETLVQAWRALGGGVGQEW